MGRRERKLVVILSFVHLVIGGLLGERVDDNWRGDVLECGRGQDGRMWLLDVKLGKVNGGLISDLVFTFFLWRGLWAAKLGKRTERAVLWSLLW